MEAHLLSRNKRLKHCHENSVVLGQKNPIFRKWSGNIRFSDLPLDVLGMILSKLPLKEIVRTSVLSNKWKHTWTVCPKLRFDGATMCGKDAAGAQHYTQKFIANVNTVLNQYHGKVVEELELKFQFDAMLAEHLDDWVKFALSSRAKNLALDLVPTRWELRPDRYRFPIELFDGESISRVQHLQLRFVSFESPPSRFNGFPNLKKLDLHVLRATRQNFEDMLSDCINLEWLSIVRCHLDDKNLTVLRPLPRLLYLHVAHCKISVIVFQTFVYHGAPIPFYLGCALALKDARLHVNGEIPLGSALTTLPKLLPGAQDLILHSSMPLKVCISQLISLNCFLTLLCSYEPYYFLLSILHMPGTQGNVSKFSQLKYLQLDVIVQSEDLSNLLSLASFLVAAPFIETLEIHFHVCALPDCSELIRRFPRSTHNYLKNLSITGFAGCTGKVELLVHIVENAPNLETLTVDRVSFNGYDDEYELRSRSKALDIARKHLDGRTSQNTKVSMM
ncbi:hypothetical protein BS78_09G231600 [Paspalum vaginatum]|nr:hypothetical protein BS78_09G231600 [Paspalum vaginatum]